MTTPSVVPSQAGKAPPSFFAFLFAVWSAVPTPDAAAAAAAAPPTGAAAKRGAASSVSGRSNSSARRGSSAAMVQVSTRRAGERALRLGTVRLLLFERVSLAASFELDALVQMALRVHAQLGAISQAIDQQGKATGSRAGGSDKGSGGGTPVRPLVRRDGPSQR